MRWNREMLNRAAMFIAIFAVIGGWTAYAASRAVHDVGYAVSLGLAAEVTSAGVRVNVDRTHKGDRLEVSAGAPAPATSIYRGPHFSILYPARVI